MERRANIQIPEKEVLKPIRPGVWYIYGKPYPEINSVESRQRVLEREKRLRGGDQICQNVNSK